MFKNFIMSIMFKKGAKAGAKVLVAALISATPFMRQHGIDISIDEAILTAAIVAGLEMLRNFVKQKYNLKGI